MARVTLQNLRKEYHNPKAAPAVVVQDINLEVHDREFMVLVGPSGCGKSTTLRMIAGLEDISSGAVMIDGAVMNDVQPKDRDIAMVFQNYALYPHMTVFENMAFGLKLRKIDKGEIARRVGEAAAMLGLDQLLERKPKQLSGGQRQRVAVGRAIVRKPKVFLFDEPLSNLDAKMRVSTRTEIARLHARLGATMIYVTHDQVEAMTMGDRICVMKDGKVQQVAAPLELYKRPANLFVAGFIGSPPMNFFRGRLAVESGGLVFLEKNDRNSSLRLSIPAGFANENRLQATESVVMGVRPESISIASAAHDDGRTRVEARVELCEAMGAETMVHLTTGTHEFVARIKPIDVPRVGTSVRIHIEPADVCFFDAKSETRIS